MSTGPKSPDGKSRSSQNRLSHGCCSEALILPNEKEEDWLQLRQAWIDDYQPDNPTFLSLLVETARAEWFLRRKTLQYQKFEQSLSKNTAIPSAIRSMSRAHGSCSNRRRSR
jgi:hypothetical protein